MPDQTTSSKHFFLTVLLTDQYLQSSLVSNNGQGVQIKEFSEIKSYFDRQDLLDQLDKSLQQLGPDSQDIVETVFAFDQSWLESNGELSDEKKPIVKEITENLSLEALGQFSIPEALAEARLIGDEADSCLLLICKPKSLDLLFLKHGQFVDLLSVGRSDNVAHDFTEVLARARRHLQEQEGKYFPGKVLLTSLALTHKELEALHHQLLTEDWTKNPGFADTPTIVVLESDYMIKSASLSAGKILNKETFLAKLPAADDSARELDAQPSTTASMAAVAASSSELPPAVPVSSTQSLDPQAEYAIETPTATSFGINFDRHLVAGGAHSPGKQAASSTFEEDDDSRVSRPSKARSPLARFYLAHQKIILLGVAGGLLGLLALSTAYASFLAKVNVFIKPEESLLQKSITITLDPNLQNSDFDKALLKATLDNKTISGQDVLATTGIGLVGDKAKGKVTIFNKTDKEVELKSGEVLSKDGIEFLLDENVKIPEAKEKQGGSGVDYGKAEVAVTAKDIGAEANFNKDTKLRVADYFDDKFSANTLENFSGGSSREVRVVAEADQTKLLQNLEEKLIQDARAELEQDSKEGVYLVPTGKTVVRSSDFSAEVGAETDSLTLSLTVEVEVVRYSSADLKTLGLDILKKDLPAGYSLLDEEPSLLSDKAQAASGSSKITLSAELSAKAIANLDLDELKKTVLGKPWLEVEESLADHGDIKSARVRFSPPFLIRVMRQLPSDESRVILQIE